MPYRLNAITGELDLVVSAASGGGITQIDGDSGSVLPVAGVVNIVGDPSKGVSTSGVGDTLVVTVDDATTTQKGVVELATDAEAIAGSSSSNLSIVPSSLAAKLGAQTQYGLAIGNTTSGAFNWTAAGTDGQIPIAATGANPAFASVTSSGGTITISGGANTLNLEAAASVPTTFTTDAGAATPAANNLDVLGGTLINTSGAGDAVTINADSTVVASVATDSGTATPAANSFSIVGSGGITTSAAGSIVTIIGTSELIVPVTPLTDLSSPYIVLSSDYYLSCDVGGGVLTIRLPNAPTTGTIYVVKDRDGDAATNNITVTTVGGAVNIDGATSFVMNTAFEAANFLFNGSTWEVF